MTTSGRRRTSRTTSRVTCDPAPAAAWTATRGTVWTAGAVSAPCTPWFTAWAAWADRPEFALPPRSLPGSARPGRAGRLLRLRGDAALAGRAGLGGRGPGHRGRADRPGPGRRRRRL